MDGSQNDIHILIADDHPIVRKGLRQVIEAEAGLKVVGEADDGVIALERIKQLQPRVAVLDIHMPKMSGFELARAIREQRIGVAVIFLTMHKAEDMFNAAMELGVKGYVLKDSAVTDIVGSIRAAAAGQSYISPQLSNFLLNRSMRQARLGRVDADRAACAQNDCRIQNEQTDRRAIVHTLAHG